MSIDQIPEYTGETPVIGQEQNEFNTNTKDQLDFFNQQAVNINTFATQANTLGDSVEVSEQNAASSAATAQAAADSVANTQFVRSRIGNISDYAGNTLTESERFNIYQYPDDSEEWYGVKEGEVFPITIPSNPSIDTKWAQVNALSNDWGDTQNGTQVKHRRGTNAEIMAGVPAIGELWFNTTDNSIHMGDGVTLGGIKHLNTIVADKRYDQNASIGRGYAVTSEGRIMVNDLDGSRVPNGKLFTYELGTTTPKATYISKELTSQNTNPVILDGDGLGNIFIGGSYTMVLKTSGDVTLWTMDVFNPNLKNYNLLSEGITKIALQAKSFIRKQIIITGDSLSFNGFGYPAGWPVAGAGYATDQPLGISPWSAILRDSIIAANSFQSIKDLKMVTNCDLLVPNSSERAYHGMNAVAMFFTPNNGVYDGTDSTTLVSEYSGGQALLIGSRPQGTGASFDLNGVTISTDSDDGQNLGFGYKVVPFTPVSGQFCNIENIQGAPLTVYGIAPSNIKIPKITGKGAWTSTQILAEYDDLVSPYNPGVIFYIIGANDAGSGDPDASGYNASVQAFIDKAKTDNPNVEIILISMPPTSSYTADRTTQYVRAGYNMALKNKCSHVDLYNELLNYPVSDWRFDNIHCKTNGDTIWFNIFKQLLFPGLDVPEIYQPIREYFAFTKLRDYQKADTFTCSVQLTAGTPTLLTSSGSEYDSKITLEYAVEAPFSVCKVTLPKHYTVANVEGLVLSDSQASIVRFNKNIQNNVFTVVTVGVGTNTSINPDGSGLYFLFSATTDFN